MPFDEDPMDSRSELDMCIDEIKALQKEAGRPITEHPDVQRLIGQITKLQVDIARMGKEIERMREELEKHRWTPVSKGLPKKGQFCHLYMPEFNSNCPQKGWYSPDKKVWTTLVRSYCRTRKVTHWMPIALPEQALQDKPGE